MTDQSPKNGPDIPSQTRLREALSQIAKEIEDQPLRSSSLARIMRETFGGSDAGGAWSWRMAYDVMQAAAVMQVVQGSGSDAFSTARLLASRLLTETRRSEAQIRLQQFSTPLPYAALAVRAATIRPGETMLEPSAGTGALAAFAVLAGGKPLLNEIDPFRRALLEAVFDTEVTGFDAEHIADLLTVPNSPASV
jgi:tRNA G10  N-methylase Trm11